jgi:hypothetical protein
MRKCQKIRRRRRFSEEAYVIFEASVSIYTACCIKYNFFCLFFYFFMQVSLAFQRDFFVRQLPNAGSPVEIEVSKRWALHQHSSLHLVATPVEKNPILGDPRSSDVIRLVSSPSPPFKFVFFLVCESNTFCFFVVYSTRLKSFLRH